MDSHPSAAPADEPRGRGELNAAISNAIVALQRDFLGRGPTRARASIYDDTVVVLLWDTLTKAERTLVEAGRHEDVLRVRQTFQRTMEPEAVAAVEQLTGRRVVAFLSDNHIEPDLACEIFVLAPQGESAGRRAPEPAD